MKEYGFTENQDFLLLKNEQQTGRGGHNKVDHIIKLDMAKWQGVH
ncbi:phage antirepressor protein [Streptococcus pneumoniae]|nr:phage antirepressor protein [Streptococcus pneumoniae]CJM35703.1 phage antirepressor protein [Streptococcus pneumoniae]COB34122.1 phage antirepressor protein [Streptococcus pneumoniae]COC77505.1 phage antirepressor protein [Streptococcus pneumoniae]COO65615.1 phage antirepressor protein [Streptococcus pneumoniae]